MPGLGVHILAMCPLVTPAPRGTHTCGMTCTQEDRTGESPMQALEVASDVLQGIKEFQVPWVRFRIGSADS